MEAIAALASQLPESIPPEPQVILEYLQSNEDLKPAWNQFLTDFGYLSEVATDISVPTWRERPEIVAQSIQLLRGQTDKKESKQFTRKSVKDRCRLSLKGEVAQIYNRLLAHLRWTFLALEQHWINQNILDNTGDIFLFRVVGDSGSLRNFTDLTNKLVFPCVSAQIRVSGTPNLNGGSTRDLWPCPRHNAIAFNRCPRP